VKRLQNPEILNSILGFIYYVEKRKYVCFESNKTNNFTEAIKKYKKKEIYIRINVQQQQN
jgi:hypothetical protein